jgi:alpha-glucosidase
LEEFGDGINADRFAQDYRHSFGSVNSSDKINVHMAPGGGWTAKLVKE